MSVLTNEQRRENFFVFLDRDGTIIEERNYLSRLEDIKFFPGSETAIARLNRAGLKVVVVSNQSGVARGCSCRKPRTGMFEQAACDFGGGLRGVMVGDNHGDLEAGHNAGLATVLVRTGYGERIYSEGKYQADFVAQDLTEAADWILQQNVGMNKLH
jgi:D-glycero-D-manno-heptose 1,7-bisphosphate phosphatase